MKLREIKNESQHYFEDEQDRLQGEYKTWYPNGFPGVVCYWRDGNLHGKFKDWHKSGQQRAISHWRDGKYHGECKRWGSSGELTTHAFDINNKEIVDFLKNPELYPETDEAKTMFVLKYGSAPFIGESE